MVQQRMRVKGDIQLMKGTAWIGLESNYMTCGWVELVKGTGLVLTLPMSDDLADKVLSRGEESGVVSPPSQKPRKGPKR